MSILAATNRRVPGVGPLASSVRAAARPTPVGTIQRWLKKLRDDSAALEPVRFVELAPGPVVHAPAAMATVRVGAVSIELRTFAHVRDLAGHVVAVADEAGEVVERFAYAEHGEALDAETGAPVVCGATCGTRVGTAVGYRGMRRLGLGDAYDARYRIYDAQLRLFWSKDPLGWVDGYDRWAYVGGDPVNLWDPWGLAAAPERARSPFFEVPPDLSEAQLRERAQRLLWRGTSRLAAPPRCTVAMSSCFIASDSACSRSPRPPDRAKARIVIGPPT
jgi:RHS repeat-associated protein